MLGFNLIVVDLGQNMALIETMVPVKEQYNIFGILVKNVCLNKINSF